MLKRTNDIFLSLLLLPIILPIHLLLVIIVKLTSTGPALHWSKRVGRNNIIFKMPKFRTMYTNTPQVATHLLQDAGSYITPIGKILRKTSLDELPQLISIFTGEMSFVGPRPALFNQDDLVQLRTSKGIEQLTPGLTGWAQINGRDEIPISEKVKLDEYYLKNKSLVLDIRILFMTFFKIINSEGVKH
jgi:O-antigen biosynthesis protein WbqP